MNADCVRMMSRTSEANGNDVNSKASSTTSKLSRTKFIKAALFSGKGGHYNPFHMEGIALVWLFILSMCSNEIQSRSMLSKPFILGYLILSCFVSSCETDDNWQHLKTLNPSNGVYIERIYKSNGVYGGSCEKYFATDSITYRFEVGTSDDNSYLKFKVDGKFLIVEEYSRNGPGYELVDCETYELE